MGLQNRVKPTGELFDNPARGMFTGNRGVIHDPDTKTLSGRRWTTKSWIVCSCAYKGRRRDVWGRNSAGKNGPAAGWSELFFLDEVTALAAGHRPCFTCRREAAVAYHLAFADAFRIAAPLAREIDAKLHAERRLSSREKPQALSAIDLPGLPDGTMVEAGGRFFAMKQRRALPWDFAGYGKPQAPGELLRAPVTLVTPKTTMQVLRQGFAPVWHGSAA